MCQLYISLYSIYLTLSIHLLNSICVNYTYLYIYIFDYKRVLLLYSKSELYLIRIILELIRIIFIYLFSLIVNKEYQFTIV